VTDFLTVLIPIIVAGLTTIIFDGLKRGLDVLDNAPMLVKQALVAVLAVALTKAAAALGIVLSTSDVYALNPEDISALASAGLAYLFHAGKQNKAIREGV
jgi:hypothetical protein